MVQSKGILCLLLHSIPACSSLSLCLCLSSCLCLHVHAFNKIGSVARCDSFFLSWTSSVRLSRFLKILSQSRGLVPSFVSLETQVQSKKVKTLIRCIYIYALLNLSLFASLYWELDLCWSLYIPKPLFARLGHLPYHVCTHEAVEESGTADDSLDAGKSASWRTVPNRQPKMPFCKPTTCFGWKHSAEVTQLFWT